MNISEKFKAFSALNRPALLCAFCILCLPFFLRAQQNKLTVAQPEEITVKRGGAVTQTLRVTILPGFHVNSDKPRDEFLIPLKLSWTDGPLETKSITFPKPEEIKVGNNMLLVFTGTFEIRTEFKAPENTSAGAARMNGKLRYQACNSEMCFRPTSTDIRVAVVVQ